MTATPAQTIQTGHDRNRLYSPDRLDPVCDMCRQPMVADLAAREPQHRRHPCCEPSTAGTRRP